jgi:uncharacterized membrane protein
MAHDLLSDEEKALIVASIKEAELATSGEIRLHVENHCKEDVLDRASEVFSILNMHKTELRNGVLFYLAAKDHKFGIIGDIGINQKVENLFWGDIKEHMQSRFKAGNIALGLSEGIKMAGQQLKMHFPAHENDKNEISDDISFGNN